LYMQLWIFHRETMNANSHEFSGDNTFGLILGSIMFATVYGVALCCVGLWSVIYIQYCACTAHDSSEKSKHIPTKEQSLLRPLFIVLNCLNSFNQQ
jgi:hypothetical protein